MTTHLFALGNRARSIAAVAVLAFAAVLITAPTPARAASGRRAPVLAQGAGMGAKPSAQVRAVQRALPRRGYDIGPPGVDGRVGPLTAAAVRRMQADYGLAVDGGVGNHTRTALRPPRLRVSQKSRSHTDRRLKATHELKARSTERSAARSVAPLTTARNMSLDLGQPRGNLLDSAVAGALGAVITLLSAMAVGLAHGRRSLRQEVLAAKVAPSPTNQASWERPMQLVDDADTAAPVSATVAAVRPSPSHLPPGQAVIGYVTVFSTDSGSGEEDEASAAIEATCGRSGWKLLEIVRDRENGRILARPGLGYALERIADGHANGLVVSDLQRLSRSIVDLGVLMAWFRDVHATLIALDLDIDTSTPEGHHVAATLIALSAREHERLANRTRNGPAGRPTGRPAVSHRPELLERIAAMRAANMTLQAIADQLNAERVPTLRGGTTWRPSSIQTALGYRRPVPRDHLPSLDRRARP
jgi:DNA invertase Pin-like site-specific DNA recombinase/peptidoglycan hydrolase-like protein with peptidoglycan-binding domain